MSHGPRREQHPFSLGIAHMIGPFPVPHVHIDITIHLWPKGQNQRRAAKVRISRLVYSFCHDKLGQQGRYRIQGGCVRKEHTGTLSEESFGHESWVNGVVAIESR